jgi:hypothetical protein
MKGKERKRSKRRNERLLSPEAIEIIRRLKHREPELDEILKRVAGKDTEDGGKDNGLEASDEGPTD